MLRRNAADRAVIRNYGDCDECDSYQYKVSSKADHAERKQTGDEEGRRQMQEMSAPQMDHRRPFRQRNDQRYENNAS